MLLLRTLPVVTKTGTAPVGRAVVGRFPDIKPATPVDVPARLGENCASATGKRSPTKNVAGFPSSARSKMRRPVRTSESISKVRAGARHRREECSRSTAECDERRDQ